MKSAALIILSLLSGSGSVLAADPFRGAEIYSEHCMRCHGGSGEGNGLDVQGFRQGNAMVQPDSVLLDSIKYGNGLMPAYSGMLDEQQIEDVLSHLRTLY